MRIVKEWTMQEIETLWIYYPNSTTNELRELFPGRSIRSITHKASRIGLRKEPDAISRTGKESTVNSYVDKFPELTKEVLEELYVKQRKSSRKIGDMFGCKGDVVLKRLRRFGIPVRKDSSSYTPEERRQKWGRKGDEHPNWKGGITEVNGLIRNRIAHVSLEAFRRDGFKCVECGGGEHNLNAHHIRPFSEIVAEIREENGLHDLSEWDDKEKLADICANDSRLLDVGNLITLCEECHYEIHHGQRDVS